MKNNNLKKLLKYSDKGAKLQTKNLLKAEKYFKLIDFEFNKLLKNNTDLKLECDNIIYDIPVSYTNKYFRPFFKMSTHKKIKSAKADDTHAVDFDIPINTDVISITNGIITAVNKNGITDPDNPDLAGKDNYIYIYNQIENKIYCFRHVKPLDSLEINSKITKGMLLGKTDNSGYSITPHLHFAIYKIMKDKKYILKSLAIKIKPV